jgi:hypothetical protein
MSTSGGKGPGYAAAQRIGAPPLAKSPFIVSYDPDLLTTKVSVVNFAVDSFVGILTNYRLLNWIEELIQRVPVH